MSSLEKVPASSSKWKLNRRRFLTLLGGSGAALLAARCAPTAETPQRPRQPEGTTPEAGTETDPIYAYREAYGQPVDYGRFGVEKPTLPEIANTPDPLARPIYFGLTPNNQDWLIDQWAINESESLLHKKAALIHFYQDWGENPEGSQFQPEWMDRLRQNGSIPTITWMPGDTRFWKQTEHPDFQKFSLKNIAEGKFDDYIRQWATAARDWGHPFFLRFGHEMNGNTQYWQYPWVTGTNPENNQQINSPEEFVAAWRHVHDICTEVGATNITWVWCPDSAGNIEPDFLWRLYPDDEYVDWIATDIYEWGPEKPHEDFFENLKNIYNTLVRLAPNKPIMLAETGSQQLPSQKAQWARDTWLGDLPWLFPQIQAVIYFDKDKTKDEGRTWRVNTDEEARAGLEEGFSSEYYAESQFSQISQSPIPLCKQVA